MLPRAAVEAGASGVIVGGALVPELTHLDTGFFACPGATSEVVHEHRGRLRLPATFLHHRQSRPSRSRQAQSSTFACC